MSELVCRFCGEPLQPCTHNPPADARHYDSKVTGNRGCLQRTGKDKDHQPWTP